MNPGPFPFESQPRLPVSTILYCAHPFSSHELGWHPVSQHSPEAKAIVAAKITKIFPALIFEFLLFILLNCTDRWWKRRSLLPFYTAHVWRIYDDVWWGANIRFRRKIADHRCCGWIEYKFWVFLISTNTLKLLIIYEYLPYVQFTKINTKWDDKFICIRWFIHSK